MKREKENRGQQIERMKSALQGTGRYIFQNKTKGDLMLPKMSLCGNKTIVRGGKFEGDSYFFKLVPSDLSFVEEIKMTEILLTEQPPIFTVDGQVELVKTEPGLEPLNEISEKPTTKQKKLLNEPANGSVKIIR